MPLANTKPLTKLVIVWLLTLIILIAKAFVMLPFPQRFIEGHHLYRVFNEWQFKETVYFTFFIILWLCRSRLQLYWRWCLWLAVASSLINLGLMIIDARSQVFYIDIEKAIAHDYGSPNEIFLKAAICLGVGLILFIIAWFKHAFATMAMPNNRWEKWQRNVFWAVILVVVLIGLMNIQLPYQAFILLN